MIHYFLHKTQRTVQRTRLILLMCIALNLTFLFGCASKPESKVCFGSSEKNCFFVEIADTPKLQERGLMFRTNLPEDQGMLFIFNETAAYSFWMKNTKIPLDIIWLDENQEIVYIVKNMQPCPENSQCPIVSPRATAAYVLELNAGTTDRLWLQNGDKMEIEIKNSAI